jgi:hypothetical protein
MAKFSIAPAPTAQDRRRGSHISIGIMFLMFSSVGDTYLYIKQAGVGEA